MSDLYQKCEHCPADPYKQTCKLCNGVGFVPVGVTTGQLERMVDNERALSGDPGIPLARRLELVGKLAAACHKAFERLAAEGRELAETPPVAAFDGATPRTSDTISHKTKGNNA